MFSLYHMIWLALCAVLATCALAVLQRRAVALRSLLTAACVGAALSELVKVLSMIEMVPSADGRMVLPYLKPQELPLHLCSLQIVFIFYARFAKEGPRRTLVLAFMYPTCLLGGLAALALPSIFSAGLVAPEAAFTTPLAYQFFLYHTMLVTFGAYILLSRQVALRPGHVLSTLGLLGALAFASLYLNSIFAGATYADGQLASVDYTPNFMFTYQPPVALTLATKGQWLLYLAALVLLAAALIALCYLPVWRRAKHEKSDGR